MTGIDRGGDEAIEWPDGHGILLFALLEKVIYCAADLDAVMVKSHPIIAVGYDRASRHLEAVIGGLWSFINEDAVDRCRDIMRGHLFYNLSHSF